MKSILKKVLSAKTDRQVASILEDLTKSEEIEWKNVGDRANNWPTIGIGTDPASGLVERITNSIDSVIDKEWELHSKPDIGSPRKAAQEWLGVVGGRLSNIETSDLKKTAHIAEKIRVSFQDSSDENYPTVEIRDYGIGIRSKDFSKTILSLNESNKLNKFHLMGAYGQGGSTALAFSNTTVIVSRRFTKDNSDKEISFTIVRINQGDYAKNKQQWVEYCVNKKTGNPFSYNEKNETVFKPGTLVRHIRMEIGKYKGQITTPSNSLWYIAHNYLFDPIIPFTISDERERFSQTGNRTVTGNNRLLTQNKYLEYNNKAKHTFKSGKLEIFWWVLNDKGEKPRERIKNYTSVRHPIIITHNGQKQGQIDNYLIKNDLKLPFIDRYLIVQIETQELDGESKRKLFSTSREKLKDTPIYYDLKQYVIDTLSEDDKLKEINKSRKENLFTTTSSEVEERVRKRLANRVNRYLSGGGYEAGGSTRSGGGGGGGNVVREPIPHSDPPTFLTIKSNDPVEFKENKLSAIKFETDAHPALFRSETFFVYVNRIEDCTYSGRTNVVDGYGIAYFKPNENASIGSEGEITFELRPPNCKTISQTIKFKIVESDNNSGGGSGNRPSVNIRPLFIDKNHPYYKQHAWNENTVADVNDNENMIYIFVNAANKDLVKIVERANRRNQSAVSSIKNKYLENIAFYSFVQFKNYQDNIGNVQIDSDKDIEITQIKEYERINASETICGMINEMFESIIIEQNDE